MTLEEKLSYEMFSIFVILLMNILIWTSGTYIHECSGLYNDEVKYLTFQNDKECISGIIY